MTLQYISGTYKERKRKQNENKDRSCCYTVSPLTYPLWHFYRPWKFLKTIRLNDIYTTNSFIHLNELSIWLRHIIKSQNLKFITLILHFFITKSFMIFNLTIFSNLQIIWHDILNLAKYFVWQIVGSLIDFITDYEHPESFFSKISNFWAWADILGWNFLRHLGYFRTISTHFGTLCSLSMFSIIQPLFLQKTKPLYPHPKYLFGIGIWASKN